METDTQSGSRKRQRDEVISPDDDDDARRPKDDDPMIDNDPPDDLLRALQDSGDHCDGPTCRFRLEAIFLPKFENENRNDPGIRQRMRELVAAGCGYAEASLKHSGSLLLWSGGHRFYSKNSANNRFTWVGEILLRQHFYRAASCWKEENDTNNDVEHLFKTCSDHVEQNRLTLSFECVTSALGDHGAEPNRDYLILTCVADRTRPHRPFYSTPHLLEFAQKFFLPHNDTWVFTSTAAIDGLFQFYDQSRETGLADSAVRALTEAANVRIPSMYPHQIVHSNILEGFVIRYVSFDDVSSLSKEQHLESLQAIAEKAVRISERIPTDAPSSFELAAAEGSSNLPAVLSANVRTIHCKADGNATDETLANSFDQDLHSILLQSGPRPTLEHVAGAPAKALQELLPQYAARVLANATDSPQNETQNIAKVIATASSLGGKLHYSLFRERTAGPADDEKHRYLFMIHVLQDQTFQKYRQAQQEAGNGIMDLFRGFCFEAGAETGAGAGMEAVETPPLNAGTEKNNNPRGLILKMKFLPYMVRTFCCRNGLKTLQQGGPRQFNSFVDNMFAKWGMSTKAHETWLPYLYAWGEYAHACFSGSSVVCGETTLSPTTLSEASYLPQLMAFEELYYNGKLQKQVAAGKVFKGLVIVLAVTEEAAQNAAEIIAREWLDGAQLLQGGIDSISKESRIKYCTRSVGGRVCWGAVTALKRKCILAIPEADRSCISLVLVGCMEDQVAGLQEKAKILGMSSSWRNIRCCAVVDLPSLSAELSNENEDLVAEAKNKVWATSDSIGEQDERHGVLVFFPAALPGCGKSTLLDSANAAKLEVAISSIKDAMSSPAGFEKRRMSVISGDKLRLTAKVKFWKHVLEQRLLNSSSITLVDKNVPVGTWEQVARVCEQTKARVVTVIPDAFAVFHTTVVDGMRPPDSPDQIRPGRHQYPFSLLYLAVCMARVMSRENGHEGKLDPSLQHVCLIVCKFFCLYRGLSSEGFLEALQQRMDMSGAVLLASPVTVPFFNPQKEATLPSDLEESLLEAIQAQMGLDSKNKNVEKESGIAYYAGLETRLRESINQHQQFLMGLTVDEETAREVFVTQVAQRLLEAESVASSSSQVIKIVAIDVSRRSVHEVLQKCRDVDSKCLNGKLEQDPVEKDEYVGQGYTMDTHVTMAHYSQLPQDAMRSQFEPMLGQQVELSISGLVWSESIAALAVEVAACTLQGIPVPKSQNSFSHITVWHTKGTAPAESNGLQVLLASGNAQCLSLPAAVVLRGTISFWWVL